MTRLKEKSKSLEGRTSVRCKDLGRVVNRGERLSKLRDSLFSTKAVDAVPVRKPWRVEHCTSEGMSKCTDLVQTANKLGSERHGVQRQ